MLGFKKQTAQQVPPVQGATETLEDKLGALREKLAQLNAQEQGSVTAMDKLQPQETIADDVAVSSPFSSKLLRMRHW